MHTPGRQMHGLIGMVFLRAIKSMQDDNQGYSFSMRRKNKGVFMLIDSRISYSFCMTTANGPRNPNRSKSAL